MGRAHGGHGDKNYCSRYLQALLALRDIASAIVLGALFMNPNKTLKAFP